MINFLDCPYSGQPATRVCCSASCRQPAFTCVNCEQCQVLHQHKGVVTTKRWEVMAPEIAQLTTPQNIGKSKREQIDKMATSLAGVLSNITNQYGQDLKNVINKLQLVPKLKLIVDDIQKKNTQEITGADIFDMLNSLESNAIHLNRGYVEGQIDSLNSSYIQFLTEVESAHQRFTVKRSDFLKAYERQGERKDERQMRHNEEKIHQSSAKVQSIRVEKEAYRRPENVESFFSPRSQVPDTNQRRQKRQDQRHRDERDKRDNNRDRNYARERPRDQDRQQRRNGGRNQRRGDRDDDQPYHREDRGERREERLRNYDRRDNARERNNEQRDEDKQKNQTNEARNRDQKQDQKPVRKGTAVKIAEIGPGDEDLFVVAKILSLQPIKHKGKTYLKCLIGDETGTVEGSFHQNPILGKNCVYEFWNTAAVVHKEHIVMNTRRPESIHESDVVFASINLTKNISSKCWVLDD